MNSHAGLLMMQTANLFGLRLFQVGASQSLTTHSSHPFVCRRGRALSLLASRMQPWPWTKKHILRHTLCHASFAGPGRYSCLSRIAASQDSARKPHKLAHIATSPAPCPHLYCLLGIGWQCDSLARLPALHQKNRMPMLWYTQACCLSQQTIGWFSFDSRHGTGIVGCPYPFLIRCLLSSRPDSGLNCTVDFAIQLLIHPI